MIVAGFICQYKKESQAKNTTYECGILPFEDARIKFDIKYFNYAILFLITGTTDAFLIISLNACLSASIFKFL